MCDKDFLVKSYIYLNFPYYSPKYPERIISNEIYEQVYAELFLKDKK